MADNAAFAARLKRLRKKAGMTQQELADASKVSIGGIRDLEQKKNGPTVETVKKLATALGVPESVLLDESEQPEPPRMGRPPKQVAVVPASICVAGAVSAGPGSVEQFEGEYLDVPGLYEGCVAYLVRGRSMEAVGIRDGCHIVVRQTPDADPGEIVVAYIDEETGTVVKKLGAGKKTLLSMPGDDSRAPIWVKAGVQILGVLKGIIYQ